MSQAVAITPACACNASTMPLSKSLPPYTPSPPAPLYSDLPSCGEQSLQYTPRVGVSWVLPHSTYIKKLGKTTVVLYNQKENARIPEYRQSGIVNGYIELNDLRLERVTEVSILIEGRLDLCIAEGTNSTTIKTLHSSTTLWKKAARGTESESMSPKCPNQLPFVFSLPRDYEDSMGGTYPLPPSFQTLDFGEPHTSLFARSSYRLRVSIKRMPKLGTHFSLLEKTKHTFIPFEYRPRTRSQNPIPSVTGSLALIKTIPDDWYQSTATIDVPSPHGMNLTFEPVTANILLPSPRVYALSDSIPFHLQLSGRVDSLRALVAPDTLELEEDTPHDDTPTPHGPSRPSSPKPHTRRTCIKRLQGEMSTSLRVFLLRQIRLEIRGKVRVQNIVIGEAQLEAVPPVMTDVPVDSREEYLSWTGRLQMGKGLDRMLQSHPLQTSAVTDVGGFQAGSYLKVNDFVALSVGSSNPPWKDVKLSVGVKLVTESWDDGNDDNGLFF